MALTILFFACSWLFFACNWLFFACSWLALDKAHNTRLLFLLILFSQSTPLFVLSLFPSLSNILALLFIGLLLVLSQHLAPTVPLHPCIAAAAAAAAADDHVFSVLLQDPVCRCYLYFSSSSLRSCAECISCINASVGVLLVVQMQTLPFVRYPS